VTLKEVILQVSLITPPHLHSVITYPTQLHPLSLISDLHGIWLATECASSFSKHRCGKHALSKIQGVNVQRKELYSISCNL